jgi:hypothetical protein
MKVIPVEKTLKKSPFPPQISFAFPVHATLQLDSLIFAWFKPKPHAQYDLKKFYKKHFKKFCKTLYSVSESRTICEKFRKFNTGCQKLATLFLRKFHRTDFINS